METNLRPLRVGEILDRTATLYRTHFLLFAGIASVNAAVVMALGLLEIVVGAVLKTTGVIADDRVVTQLWNMPSYAVMLIVGSVAEAANNRAVAWVYVGETATIRGAYQSLRGHIGRYLGIGTLKVLIGMVPMILASTAIAINGVYFQAKGVIPSPGEPVPPSTISNPHFMAYLLIQMALGLFYFPAAIYGVWMWLRYALAIPASVVEDLKVGASLKRSATLGKDGRGGLFVLGLLYFVVYLVLGLVLQGFFVVYMFKHHYMMPVWIRVAAQVTRFLVDTVVYPIWATGVTLCYFDQRVRKEGFDIEWMMRGAGMTQLPAAAEAASGGVEAAPASGEQA